MRQAGLAAECRHQQGAQRGSALAIILVIVLDRRREADVLTYLLSHLAQEATGPAKDVPMCACVQAPMVPE